ncbi:transposase-like protein [Stemphylium lycopersici]|nr:transposase-like protein [Stemphylium lycopersici]
MAKGKTSSIPYLGSRRLVFNDFQLKSEFIDWAVDLDLTFRQATHQRTCNIFASCLEDIDKVLPKSSSTLSAWIKEMWDGDGGRRAWLKERLHLAKSKIHISTDTWTSEEGTNYVAVVAHFLDEKHKLQTALLDLRPLKGPHTGENIAKVLSMVIESYDIPATVGFFMMDNANNNDTCIEELAKQYPTVTQQSRLRCVGHILNLIVKALLFGQGVSKLEKELCGASDDDRFEIWRKQSFIATGASETLEEYYALTDATPAYRCAVALHPANKFTYFELEWSHEKKWIAEAKRVVHDEYVQYKEAAVEAEIAEATREDHEVGTDSDTTLDLLQQARKRRQRVAATSASITRGRKRTKLTSELDEFMARSNKADEDVENPLEWWVHHASDYLVLSKMAFDLFSCPAMSSEYERVFSQTKKVITDERNRLNSDTVAAIECQKHLLRTSMLS